MVHVQITIKVGYCYSWWIMRDSIHGQISILLERLVLKMVLKISDLGFTRFVPSRGVHLRPGSQTLFTWPWITMTSSDFTFKHEETQLKGFLNPCGSISLEGSPIFQQFLICYCASNVRGLRPPNALVIKSKYFGVPTWIELEMWQWSEFGMYNRY